MSFLYLRYLLISNNWLFLFRYAEGTGAAANFKYISDLVFLSSTRLLAADISNNCLRLIDLVNNPPSTTRFAGFCVNGGSEQGHRLDKARLDRPFKMDIDTSDSTVYFVEKVSLNLRKINLTTDDVVTVRNFAEPHTQILYYNNML